MGGKTGTTTSSVAIPPEVMARYNDVNKQAQATAGTPFQQYSTDPNAFVAPLNQQQNAGIGGINQYANAAQPVYGAAMQGTANAYQGFNAPNYQQGVQEYMNPFLQNAMGSTAAQMQNINQQEQQKMLGNEISSGAFGGDRGKVAQAALINQQNLALGNTLGNMASSGYQNAAQNYITGLGQQGALAGQMGSLGAGSQQAGLQGAQAQLGAGTLGQQTTQAGQTALYNQFQQQQAYPFQVSQFLANIAEGTGALSGSTTTTQAPQSFFSDVRLKEDIKRVGTAKNGLPIYTFKYKGDNAEQTHVGYMAQDVEKVHPEAVGESHGYKTVDYDKASEPVHRAFGGVVANSEGGAVAPHHMGEGFAVGGDVISPSDLSALLAQQQQMYSPFEKGGLYGGSAAGTPGGKGVVPAANLHVSHLAVANPARTQQGDTLMGDVQQVENIGDTIKKANDYRKDIIGHPAVAAQAPVPANAKTGAAAQPAVAAQDATGYEWLKQYLPQGQAHGGVVGYASGGGVEPYQTDDPMSQVVSDTEKDKNKHGLMTAQNPTGQPSSTLGDLGKIASLAALPGEIASGAGAAASGIGSLMAMLAPIGLASGGVVPREHHAGPDDTNGQSNVVGNGDQTPNYEALAQATAQKYGLNPKDFGSVIKGESGFNPKAIGDEGSSAGLGQFHIAGASEKYPHAGLGDDYISARNPELAKSGTAQDKIAYLSDPANAPDQLDFMGQHVAKNGYGAWTAAKNLGLADLPAKNAVPAQAVVNGQQGFQTPDSETPKKSLGDTLMSEQFLVPLLSGLGTMAGSNSRYLGAAILQGIGGGAKAYEDVQSNIANRGLTGAQTSAQNVAAASEAQQMAQKDTYKDANGVVNVYMPHGQTMSYADWIKAKRPPTRSSEQATGVLNRIGATPDQNIASDYTNPPVTTDNKHVVSASDAPEGPTSVGGIGASQIENDARQLYQMPEAQRTAQYTMSQNRESELNNQAESARAANSDNWYLAKRIMAQPDSGWNAGGPNNSFRTEVAGRLNDALGAIGLPQWDNNKTDNSVVIEKLHTAAAAGQVSAAGQRSLESLMTMLQATPGAQMTKQAALQILGRNIINTQIPLDQQKYLNDWKAKSEASAGMPGMYLTQNAISRFRDEHSKSQQDQEQRMINAFFTTKDPQTGQTHMEQYMNGEISPADIDAAYGKGFIRYLEAQ